MVKIFTVTEMTTLERAANASGLSYEAMMENAGKGLANEIFNAYSHYHNNKILALVGSGNNGGDTLIALNVLASQGWDTTAYIVHKRDPKDPLIERLQKNGGNVIDINADVNYEKLGKLISESGILIDGVLGTGIKLPLRGAIANILKFVNHHPSMVDKQIKIIAVDCPSGINCDTGETADDIIQADMTVTMAGIKIGLLKFPAAIFVGNIRVVSIGDITNLKEYQENYKIYLTSDFIRQFIPIRPLDSHKGTFGTAFIIAGSVNYTGAALLAGIAAYRVGTGLVMMGVPESLHTTLAGRFPEATWVLLSEQMGVVAAQAVHVARQNIDRATAILIGPGFGLEETTKEFLHRFFSEGAINHKGRIGFLSSMKGENPRHNAEKPIIIDADGLKLLSRIDNWAELLPRESILTPHPGEMSVMTGIPIKDIQENRIQIASEYASKWGHVLVLKGAFTVVADPNGRVGIVPIASPALARAGTGDVLAGLITGLRAQGVSAYEAACAGAWIHAKAGLLAAEELGNEASVIASDVLNAVSQVISSL
jgi:ADP-dependent NAD(P)H-hydrate dehydratase / NAD(P)H-hydrate epimerase